MSTSTASASAPTITPRLPHHHYHPQHRQHQHQQRHHRQHPLQPLVVLDTSTALALRLQQHQQRERLRQLQLQHHLAGGSGEHGPGDQRVGGGVRLHLRRSPLTTLSAAASPLSATATPQPQHMSRSQLPHLQQPLQPSRLRTPQRRQRPQGPQQLQPQQHHPQRRRRHGLPQQQLHTAAVSQGARPREAAGAPASRGSEGGGAAEGAEAEAVDVDMADPPPASTARPGAEPPVFEGLKQRLLTHLFLARR